MNPRKRWRWFGFGWNRILLRNMGGINGGTQGFLPEKLDVFMIITAMIGTYRRTWLAS